MICDIHTHSIFSFDGTDSVDAFCGQAIAKGVSLLSITDHSEAMIDTPFDKKEHDRLAGQMRAVLDAQKKYAGKLQILRGCELGQPHLNPEYAKRVISEFHFDYIIGSLHFFADMQDIYFVEYTRENLQDYLVTYFTEIEKMLDFEGFQALGHLDYIMRLFQNCTDGLPTFRGYEAYVDVILKKLVQKNLALEINTAGLRKWMGCLTLEEWILKRFRELGGKYVTIGSDAHAAEDVGTGFSEACALLRDCGFDAYTYFVDQKPVLEPIG